MALPRVGVELALEGSADFFGGISKAEGAIGDLGTSASKGAGGLNVLGSAASAAGLAVGGALVAGIAAAGGALLDVSARASEARTALQGLNGVDYGQVLNDASLLEARYGADLQSVLGATRTLMSEFGLSSQEATNLIISGFEGGLDTSGDFLDSIGEYSNLYAQNGASASEFFSTLQTGLAGGALGTDKAADAFKEFGIRIQDGSATTRDALAALGIEDVLAGISAGTLTVADAFPIVQEAIRGVNDPILQAQLGVALFGTQFEDLGADALLAISTTATSMADLAATADNGRQTISSLGEVFPRLWAAGSNALLPLNDALLGFANAVLTADDPLAELGNQLQQFGSRAMAAVQEAIPQFRAGLAQMAQALGAWVQEGLPQLITNLSTARDRLVGWALENLPKWTAELGKLAYALYTWVLDALPGLGTNLGKIAGLLITKTGEFLGFVTPKLLELGALFVSWVATEALPRLPGELVKVGGALLSGIGNFIREVAPEIGKLAQKFITWVQEEVLPKAPGELAKIGTAIVTGIGAFIGSVGTEAGKIGTAIIDGIVDMVAGGVGKIVGAVQQAAQDALESAKRALGISSPSQVFADEVGRPIVQGIARGILDSLDLVLDAAGDVSWAVLDEAKKLAKSIESALGPLLADAYKGAIDFAGGQINVLDTLDRLEKIDTSKYDRLARDAAKASQEAARLFFGDDKDAAAGAQAIASQLAAQRNAAKRVIVEQQAIAARAQQQLAEVQRQASTLGVVEGAQFLKLRTAQISRLAQEEQKLAAATTAEERDRVNERIALLKRQQQAELALYEHESKQRAAKQAEQLRDAKEALKQLGNLVFYSQQDVFGKGSDLIQGLIKGALSQTDALKKALSGLLADALAAARKQMGIKSPSTVFADRLGAPLAQGVGIGFSRAMGGVASQVSADLLGAASTAAQTVRPPASAAQLVRSSSTTYAPVSNYHYNPTYQGAPRQPMQDFAIMRSLYGRG